MKRTNVFRMEGTGRPRRCAIQTPKGSIDAAAIDAASIFRGVVGMIIDEIRMTIVFHDRCPIVLSVGTAAQVLSMATATAFAIMYQRPASIFVCGACFA